MTREHPPPCPYIVFSAGGGWRTLWPMTLKEASAVTGILVATLGLLAYAGAVLAGWIFPDPTPARLVVFVAVLIVGLAPVVKLLYAHAPQDAQERWAAYNQWEKDQRSPRRDA